MKDKQQPKRILKRLMALSSIALLILVAIFLIKYKLDIDQQYRNSAIALKEVKQVINKKTDFRRKKPKVGDAIGTIKLANHSGELPIIEGEDIWLSMWHGVGRLPFGVMPGSKRKQQVLLSGHRETFFLHLKDVKKGEIITIKMPYHTYRYKVDNMKIVKDYEASKVYKNGKLDREELVLITCYPFSAFANPDRRYIVTAYPVD